MTAEYAQTGRFRGARIHLCDLAGLEIRDCQVSAHRGRTRPDLRSQAGGTVSRPCVVRRCLTVVLKEEAEHHRYALRDLAVLEVGARTE